MLFYTPLTRPTYIVDGIASTLTGTTSQTLLKSWNIRGGLLGPNGIIEIFFLISATNNANNKTINLKMGSQDIIINTDNGYASCGFHRCIYNKNSTANQETTVNSGADGLGSSTGSITSATVETNKDFLLEIYGTLSNAGDTLTFESTYIDIIRPIDS